MRYTIELEVMPESHAHNTHGIPGLMPVNLLGEYGNLADNYYPFWSADGLFHDIFEHWFEGIIPYFRGRQIGTVWGEMAASGLAYFFHTEGYMETFRYRANPSRDYTIDTIGYFDPREYDENQLGKCTIPFQRRGTDVDNLVSEYYDLARWRLKDYRAKIRRAYRFGYHLGERYWGHLSRGKLSNILYGYLEQFHQLTKRGKIEEGLYLDTDDGEWSIRRLVAHIDTRAEEPMKLYAKVHGSNKPFKIRSLNYLRT